MKRTAKYSPLISLAVVAAYIYYFRQDPQCDRGCKDRWDHLMNHLLPIILQRWGFQG